MAYDGTTAAIQSATTSTDQEKFLAMKLIQRAQLKLVCNSICDKIQQPTGTGTTAYFVRYNRMNLPMVALTEATDPASSTFTLTSVTVTLDQWGDVLTLSDLAELTTSHPLVKQALELLSDNAQRVIDRETQIVWFTGTNIQYGDSTVVTRRLITTSMKISDTIIARARITLADAGAPPKGGPSSDNATGKPASGNINGAAKYVAVCGPQVMGDVMIASTSFGSWVSVATYANQKALYNAEMGEWLGVRFVETNFIPKLQILGNTTAAVVSAAAFGTNTPVVTAVTTGGTLTSATTYFYKVTRKDLTRGFEEFISIAHSTASTSSGDNESFTFDFTGLTAGYVYNVYFDSVQAGGTGTDATLKLVSANIAVGATLTVTGIGTGVTPPDNVNPTGTPTVHPVYFHGNESCNWVGLQNLEVIMSQPGATTHNPLKLRRTLGYKFMGKTMIRDNTRMLRVEVASTY